MKMNVNRDLFEVFQMEDPEMFHTFNETTKSVMIVSGGGELALPAGLIVTLCNLRDMQPAARRWAENNAYIVPDGTEFYVTPLNDYNIPGGVGLVAMIQVSDIEGA